MLYKFIYYPCIVCFFIHLSFRSSAQSSIYRSPEFNFSGTKVEWHHRPKENNKVRQIGEIYQIEQLFQNFKPLILDEKLFFLLEGSLNFGETDNTLICYNHITGDSIWQNSFNRNFYRYGYNFNRGFNLVGRNLELFGNISIDTFLYGFKEFFPGFSCLKTIDELGNDVSETINYHANDRVNGISSCPIHYLEGTDYGLYYLDFEFANRKDTTHGMIPFIWNDTFGIRKVEENSVYFNEPNSQFSYSYGPIQLDAASYRYFYSLYNFQSNNYKHFTWLTTANGKPRDLLDITNIIGSNQFILFKGVEKSKENIRISLLTNPRSGVKANIGYLYLDNKLNIVKDQRSLSLDNKKVGRIKSIDLMDNNETFHVVKFNQDNNLSFYIESADGKFRKTGEFINKNKPIYGFIPKYLLQTKERDIILTLEGALDTLFYGEYYVLGGWPFICKIKAQELSIISSTNSTVDKLDISIFPNPSTDFLHVNYPNKIKGLKYKLVNAIGEEVKSGDLHNSASINISTLNSGIFIAYFYHQDRLVYQEKFVKF